MWRLQTNMPHADNIQDMVRTDNAETDKDHAHTHSQITINMDTKKEYQNRAQ